MKTNEGKPIETAVGRLYPSLKGDFTRDGTAINKGSMFFTMAGGVATIEHDGQPVKIDIASQLSGATVLRAPNGRQFTVDLEKLIEHAIENGLLNAELRFEKEE
jgi:hypothetical protein